MSNARTEADRRRDYCTTLSQRRLMSGWLRDGYDRASADTPDETFSVSLHTSDLPSALTAPNRRFLGGEHAVEAFNELFGHIALNATVEIDMINDEYVISLLRRAVNDTTEQE